MGQTTRAVTDFLHDLAAGLFPGAVLGTWIIRRALDSASLDSGASVGLAASGLWLVLVAGLALSAVTGLIRLRYWKLNVRAGYLEAKAQMAIVKHAVFVLTLVASAVLLQKSIS